MVEGAARAGADNKGLLITPDAPQSSQRGRWCVFRVRGAERRSMQWRRYG
jgi:hypothetical protein